MKIKISPSDITMGPKDFDLDSVAAMCYAEEYKSLGYRKTSNAYCNIAKIDREDWVHVLAKQLRCAPADFYKLDGSGIDDRWRDHYVRTQRVKQETVSPAILKFIPSY